MNKSCVIIYNQKSLFDILDEIKENLNFDLVRINSLEELEDFKQKCHFDNLILLTSNKELHNKTSLKEIIIEKKPYKLVKLVEKINIFLLKNKFAAQSKLNIKNFILDINSRELIKDNLCLKLTQKETEVIIYLNNAGKNVSTQNLQKHVWGYTSDLETHTVETHIYRLRKKILNKFKDNKFILSSGNGYKI